MRWHLLVAAWMVVVGLTGHALMGLDLDYPWPEHGCQEAFTGPLQLTPLISNAPEPYLLTGTLQPRRPDLVIQHQIIDRNGFGWVMRQVAADAPATYRTTLPNIRDTHTIRIGILASAEAARASEIDHAARAFSWQRWRAAKGWVAPQLTLCQEFTLDD